MMTRPSLTRPTLLLAALFVALGAAPGASAQQGRVHVVQPGETLYRIATTNGLSVDQLKELNGLVANTIRVGQRLRLSALAPEPDTPSDPTPDASELDPDEPETDGPDADEPGPDESPAAGPTVHTVARGETLYRLSLRYDTTVGELRRLNRLTSDQIEIGQQLIVDGAAAPAPDPGTGRASGPRRIPTLSATERSWALDRTTVASDLVHFVDPGETLYSIAARYGIASQDLIDQNSVTTAPLEPGQMLALPEAVNPAWADAERLPAALGSGLALVYPDVMRGRPTTSGEPYDPLQFTASHRQLPLGTVLLVTNPANGRSTFVRITDTGPVSEAYVLELSAAAATAIGLDPNAARRVEMRRLP